MPTVTIDEIASLLLEDGADCVVQYGSSLESPESAHDIDLFAVYPDASRTNLQLGRFDILRLTQDRLEYYRQMRNPVYCTEPCLTGDIIAGDPSIIERTADILESEEPPQAAINHNVNRSLEAFSDCMEALQSNSPDYTVGRLHFVTTYWLFATWYQAGNPTKPLAAVREQSSNTEILDTIFTLVEKKRSEGTVATAEVTAAIEEWLSFLLTSRFECAKKTE